jgi:uracil permease
MNDVKLLYGLKDKPPFSKTLIYAFQMLLACLGATILVPIIVNGTTPEPVLSTSLALFTAGIGTIIFLCCTRFEAGVYLGSSFAYIAPMIAGFAACGKEGVFPAIIGVGVVYVIIAAVIKVAGTGWIDKILAPVIISPAIMIIGLGLAPTAVQSIGLTGGQLEWKPITAAVVTLVAIIVFQFFTKGFVKTVPILGGLIVGYVYSLIVGIVDTQSIADAPWFAIPAMQIPFVHYTPNWNGMLLIVPVAIVTLCEHIGDMAVLSTVSGKDIYKEVGLHKTILGDGLATTFAGLFGGVANTTYGESTSTMGISKVCSVWVVFTTGILAILMSFVGKFGAVLAALPGPVLGGACLVLYGFIAGNGAVQINKKFDLDIMKNKIIFSIMMVLGLGGAAVAVILQNATVTVSGMTLAAVIGIILNLALPEEK